MATDIQSRYHRKRIWVAIGALALMVTGLVGYLSRSPAEADGGKCPNPTKVDLLFKA
jgi:hypothetical protein